LKTSLTIEEAIGQKILLAFQGKEELPIEIIDAVRRKGTAGFTLFRHLNVESPAQVRRLTEQLQQIARESSEGPLLIGIDQEGGQLMAVGEGTTQLPGNMALGATGSAQLAFRAGVVLGEELAAMGINVDYAPCCDVNSNPSNPVIGTRSFGDDPQAAGEMAAAMVKGIQSCGVVSCAKHFPGHGNTSADSHNEIPLSGHSLETVKKVDLPPFKAAIEAGVKMVMSGHIALPAEDGKVGKPATLSPELIRGLLRGGMGFDGVIVSDAMDMRAIRQGEELAGEAVQAAAAGVDLLLMKDRVEDQRAVYQGLLEAAGRGDLDSQEVIASARKVLDLKNWVAENFRQPGLDVVGCSEHRQVADEIAERSITLVRDEAHLIPIPLGPDDPIGVIWPRPLDLTPADTSSYVRPALGLELRKLHPAVSEFSIRHDPSPREIAGMINCAHDFKLVVVGTINACMTPQQVDMVQALLASGIPTIVVALRLPYDLAYFPQAPTCLCTYSLLEPSMKALARVLVGQTRAQGHLPVRIPGL
jgi:beta-N-acetylhexosaminidase